MASSERIGGRRLPVGAECLDGGVDFRLWAPKPARVDLVVQEIGGPKKVLPMRVEEGGYFRLHARDLGAGALYRFRLDNGDALYPDPVSRSQPEGSNGPSAVVDPTFAWTDDTWGGVALPKQVVYEMHIGTFTSAGTWAAATAELQELALLGVTVVEMMPAAEFAGKFGWGYDGVDLFAPTHVYGTPEDLRRFVDRAHALGMGVILDVVYNHLGPVDNYLPQFSDSYFSRTRHTDWGAAFNFDGEGSEGTREFVTANAAYWVDEFHFDGLRLDATQDIYDDSQEHILADIRRAVQRPAGTRHTLVVAENEPGDARLLRRHEEGGYGIDAIWNEDLHHTARVALTGQIEGYYGDYRGTPQELISALRWGFLFQGQYYEWQKKRRGAPGLDMNPGRFVTFLENHDQVANTARGERLWRLASPSRYRALVALLLLGPGTPMLFQGEEFAASAPFLYFADHEPDLARQVRTGRASFLSQFPSMGSPEVVAGFAPPDDRETFEQCKLDFAERSIHKETYALYRDLLALRRLDAVFGRIHELSVEGAVLSSNALLLRVFGGGGDDRLLLTNLGVQQPLIPAPEPLLAPPAKRSWRTLFSTESPKYGGHGLPPLATDGRFHLLAESTIVLAADSGRGP
jgi:maltooligosyltrehalose trehalohydrolase